MTGWPGRAVRAAADTADTADAANTTGSGTAGSDAQAAGSAGFGAATGGGAARRTRPSAIATGGKAVRGTLPAESGSTIADPADPADPEGHPRRRLVLAVLVIALQAVVLDTSVLNVALKSIAAPAPAGLGATQSALEWAVNAYVLCLAGLLFTGGLVADRLGRKRTLVTGLALFGVASVLCAYAPSPGALIAARAALGVGAAAVMPSTLAIIAEVFPRREQGSAIGIWTGSVGLAIAAGPTLGGALLDRFWWGSVFLVNVPIVLITLTAAVLVVPESRDPAPGRLDPVGVLLLLVGLVAFVYGVIGGGTGTPAAASVWVPVLGGLAVIAGFVRWETRVGHPALDVRLFRERRFTAAVLAVGANYFSLLGGMFFFTFYLQTVRGLTPLAAGLWSVPFAVSQLVFGPFSARLVRRFGARAVAGTGLLGVAAAFLAYGGLTLTSPIWGYGLVAFVQGAFAANVMPSATTVIMTAVPRERAGIASSVNNTVRQVGGALGVAVLGTVLTTAYRHRARPLLATVPLTPDARRGAAGSIQATHAAVSGRPGLVHAADADFVHALHIATLTTAAVTACAALLVLIRMPRESEA